MNETTKLKQILTPDEWTWFHGHGIDIGCGCDPITTDCVRFDRDAGDANHIKDYVTDTFDWVYSSHCLEDMESPKSALQDWWSLVDPNGYMIIVVPDEDLYEQGHIRRFNTQHKHTFTLCKRKSWSETSINVLDIIKTLKNATLITAELQDIGLDRKKLTFQCPCPHDSTANGGMAQIMFVVQKTTPIWADLYKLCKEKVANEPNNQLEEYYNTYIQADFSEIEHKLCDAHNIPYSFIEHGTNISPSSAAAVCAYVRLHRSNMKVMM